MKRSYSKSHNTDLVSTQWHHHYCMLTRCTPPSFVNDDLVHDDWPLFVRIKNLSPNRPFVLDTASYSRYDIKARPYTIISSDWMRDKAKGSRVSLAYFLREKEENKTSNNSTSFAFFSSFPSSSSEIRRRWIYPYSGCLRSRRQNICEIWGYGLRKIDLPEPSEMKRRALDEPR